MPSPRWPTAGVVRRSAVAYQLAADHAASAPGTAMLLLIGVRSAAADHAATGHGHVGTPHRSVVRDPAGQLAAFTLDPGSWAVGELLDLLATRILYPLWASSPKMSVIGGSANSTIEFGTLKQLQELSIHDGSHHAVQPSVHAGLWLDSEMKAVKRQWPPFSLVLKGH